MAELEDTQPFNKEEAHFYHSLADFEDLVKKHGATFVMSKMNKEVYFSIADYFLAVPF